MEVGGNKLNPSAQEFYPCLSSSVSPPFPQFYYFNYKNFPFLPNPSPPLPLFTCTTAEEFLLPSVPHPFPQFYYPPVLILPPPAGDAHPTRVNDDAVPTNGIVPRHVTEHDVLSGMECSSNDERTTVMIRNIPNSYSQKLLLNMLDNHCMHCNEQVVEGKEPPSAYDFVYLRIDFRTKSNVGYGFVNFTSPQAAMRLYKAFHKQPWEFFNSRKICEVTYAKLQGLEALNKHFKYKKFACDNHEYMPVIFSPPCDGKQSLTEPVAIGVSELPLACQPLEELVDSQVGDASCSSTLNHALSVAEMHEPGSGEAPARHLGLLSLHEDYSD